MMEALIGSCIENDNKLNRGAFEVWLPSRGYTKADRKLATGFWDPGPGAASLQGTANVTAVS